MYMGIKASKSSLKDHDALFFEKRNRDANFFQRVEFDVTNQERPFPNGNWNFFRTFVYGVI